MYNLPLFFHYCKNVKSTIIFSTDNLSAWERYERERDGLAAKLDAAEGEMMDTKRVCFHSWLFIIFLSGERTRDLFCFVLSSHTFPQSYNNSPLKY